MKTKILLASLVLSIGTLSAQNYQVPVSEKNEPMMKGKFQPTWESLENYQVPEWFRNAKFGIWAHWGPQCVEGSGDWMARSMYMEGTSEYKHHVEHYGHPSEVGFKDIIPLFKAEKWNPDELVAFYKKIGAQYFFALGNHHDNFDLWDSKYQPLNSKNMGPKRDVLAEWEKAARKYELPFGISFHADHAWTWYEPSQRYDRHGPKAGVPYDGTLTKADGKGKWWEGYDPQDLYAQNHSMSKGSWADGMIHSQWAWGNGACLPTQEYCTNFYDRTVDAINRYNPDLIYFDQYRIGCFSPYSFCKPSGIRHEQIITDQLHLISQLCRQFLPAFPIFFIQRILDGNDRIFFYKLFPMFDQLLRTEYRASLRKNILALLGSLPLR